eukprot:1086287-Pelagomonas_calceolata.AAC.5
MFRYLFVCMCVRAEAVGPEEIATVVSRWTGIPVVRLQQTEREKLLHLGSSLKKCECSRQRKKLASRFD